MRETLGLAMDTGVKKIDYKSSGVDYGPIDAFKRLCQQAGAATRDQLAQHGLAEVPAVRGESAYLVEAGDSYLAHVEEALGTKALVADGMYELTGESHYRAIAVDDVATILNDLVTVGALPISLAMYLAVGSANYLADEQRCGDLAAGFAEACRRSGAVWSCGETQVLPSIVAEETMVLGGSAMGRIYPKNNRIAGDVRDGDAIVFLASSGVHTNALTLCRAIAGRLPDGYLTPLPDGRTYGQALLVPSCIYVPFVRACQQRGVRLRYASHVTGHGWRKLMRLNEPFVYRIDQPGTPPGLFRFIADHSGLGASEMYATFNMGVGFAAYVRPDDTESCLTCARESGFTAWPGGRVCKEDSRKAVVIEGTGIEFDGSTLQIR